MNYHMRKKSREMNEQFAMDVFRHAPYATLAMTDANGRPYCIPISVVVTAPDTLYFHCALEGTKLDCIRLNPQVMLSAVSRCTPTVGPKDNSFTLQFKSATARGEATLVSDDTEKVMALRAICERFLPRHMEAFEPSIARSLDRTAVVRITLTEPAVGKRKQYDANGKEMKYGRME